MRFEESVDYLLDLVEKARAGEEKALARMRELLEFGSERAPEDVLIDVTEYMILLTHENYLEDTEGFEDPVD